MSLYNMHVAYPGVFAPMVMDEDLRKPSKAELMPTNFWLRIFALCSSANPDDLIQIGAVCSRWRESVLGNPPLWNTLNLTEPNPRLRTQLWMERSQGGIEDLRINANVGSGRLRSPEWMAAFAMFRRLRPERTRRLKIHAGWLDVIWLLDTALEPFSTKALPLLDSLVISTQGDTVDINLEAFWKCVMWHLTAAADPRLQTLVLDLHAMPRAAPGLRPYREVSGVATGRNFGHLRVLEITCLDGRHLLTLMARCPALEQLKVWSPDVSQPVSVEFPPRNGPRIQMPRLRDIKLALKDTELFAFIYAPEWRSLTFGAMPRSADALLRLRFGLASLKRLVLTQPSPADLCVYLEHTPNLNELEICDSPMPDVLIHCLFPRWVKELYPPPPTSRLGCLSFRCSLLTFRPTISLTQLRKVVDSRRDYGPPYAPLEVLKIHGYQLTEEEGQDSALDKGYLSQLRFAPDRPGRGLSLPSHWNPGVRVLAPGDYNLCFLQQSTKMPQIAFYTDTEIHYPGTYPWETKVVKRFRTDTIPVDIWLQIFTFYAAERTTGVYRIGAVCRHWRGIVRDNPLLWNRFLLHAQIARPDLRAQLWVERSRGRIGTLRITSRGGYDNIRTAVWLYALAALGSGLQPDGAKELDISAPWQDVVWLLEEALNPFVAKALPLLDTLKIATVADGSTMDVDLFWRCFIRHLDVSPDPRLRHLAFDLHAPSLGRSTFHTYREPPQIAPETYFRRLRSINVNFFEGHHLLTILERSPILEDLSLGRPGSPIAVPIRFPAYYGPRIEMPRLRNVQLSVEDSELFNYIRAPGLDRLNIGSRMSPAGLFRHGLTSLRNLLLPFASADELSAYLKNAPNLDGLHIRDPPSTLVMHELITTLLPPYSENGERSPPGLVSKLRHLTLECSDSRRLRESINTDVLVALIEVFIPAP
ncbi:hypothetical protein PUNSTDRAFT_130784 [Punctularia strigosozonata HHB-11173 SS5]|uniref:uncharacterized protein n=1 Tax=Punctularia strigosozonata (strain HHB-11173) TaxID=741275 RepID=UPI0004416373|nr:uncharacterized protein PUNSTDRAFT_130784 [Punctularia strigosozonata HHB-11173 SS5]EIN12527.1 hypothetical protein PUNSTDRAFT_130784 [Punctularia strigosozonata HHB-11173 SS5]